MNKLWVRLQHQGHSSERELRYKERKELKILVGSNLVRLSQIIDDYQEDDGEYKPVEYYRERIFPIITEQIIQCRDHLAQSYLIDVIIQIFPATFHFATLKMLLMDVFLSLNPMLRKSELVLTLVERFTQYYKFESDSSPTPVQVEEKGEIDVLNEKVDGLEVTTAENSVSVEGDLFQVFWNFYLKLTELDPELPSEEHSTMLQGLIKLSLTYEPKNYENLNQLYKFAAEKLSATSETDDEWLQLLLVPIDHFQTMKNLLELNHFYEFYSNLKPKFQKQISLAIIDKLFASNEKYIDQAEIDGIFKYLIVLIKDSSDSSKLNTSKSLGVTKTFQIEKKDGPKLVSLEFLQNQEKISKVLHLIIGSDPFKSLSNLMYVRKKYLNKSGDNMIYTYPTLINQILQNLKLAGYKRKSDEDYLLLTSNFKHLSVIIDEFYNIHQQDHLELILKLYLNAASIADQLKLESISYEFFTQCFIVYEENLILNSGGSSSAANPHNLMGGGSIPYQLVIAIANKLTSSRYFSKENYENLITKVTLYGSKLLKKQDQCRSVYYCAHLWWWCELFIEGSSPTVEEEKVETSGEGESEAEVAETGTLYRDPKRVLECLQKSLRVADSCMDPFLSIRLFVEILNRCLIFNVYGNYLIDSRYINGLIDLIKTNLDNLKSDNTDSEEDSVLLIEIRDLFQRSLDYIDKQKAMEGRFQDITI